ncbi:MAG: hypothetical protein AUH25_02860 [Thaumarchaeota archaeon 13_1_40CM_38_12]|nr:MAG: hypothetical protein AUH25_02860 [Thaumarchaeota archaeon 13_1_40CM_38_12]OLC35500.1 MAG: hypothetical protein AUH84_03130 [Thaumarchaeota archaeon 13_1_40CM_4_38_7]OLD28997.1 MAG: hypothetical protein AUI62_03560 [Thaumarchaeota archaeon 13_1_40CM_2_39_7]TLY09338.1 MAG: hypothetical protein E6K83_00345 [Nitrososphaerota archaeon]
MMYQVIVDLPKIKNIELELDDKIAPKTVRSFLDCLPLSVGINVWGEELYTDETPVNMGPENSKSLVELMDVAYWPQGRAICLFFGPTPIGNKDEIKPYSPVNVIGKIREADKTLLQDIKEGTKATFRVK